MSETAVGDMPAAARARKILRETPPGAGLTGDALTFMFNLLRHPNAAGKIGHGEDPGGGSRLADRGQAQRWYAYHARAARLRLVSKRANTGILRKQPQLDSQIAFCTYCGGAEHDEGACAA